MSVRRLGCWSIVEGSDEVGWVSEEDEIEKDYLLRERKTNRERLGSYIINMRKEE